MDAISIPQQQPPVQLSGKKFSTRAGAYIIDSIVFYVTNLGVGFSAGLVIGLALALSGRAYTVQSQQNQILGTILGLVLFVLYFTVFEGLYGATLGKLLLGMRVVKEGCQGCGLGAAFIRGLLRYIDGFFFAIPAYLSMKAPLFQRIGDKAAKTIVVDAKETYIQQPRAWWWFLVAALIYLALAAIGYSIVLLTMVS